MHLLFRTFLPKLQGIFLEQYFLICLQKNVHLKARTGIFTTTKKCILGM